jgi:hypothetical protein
MEVGYKDPDLPKDHFVANVNFAHAKLCAYHVKFDNAPVYYAATALRPYYKHHLEALWRCLISVMAHEMGLTTATADWLNNHQAFLRMWQDRKDIAAIDAGARSPPAKCAYAGLSASQSAFLQSSMELAIQQVEHNLKKDKYEVWKQQPTLREDH